MKDLYFSLAMSGLGTALTVLCCRIGPLRWLSRTLDYTRAGCYLAHSMIEGAWARRQRWPEMVDRARRER